jgi:hypothetical protein
VFFGEGGGGFGVAREESEEVFQAFEIELEDRG